MQRLRTAFAGWQRLPTWDAIAPELARCNAEIAGHGNFNYLLTNGEALFVHCSSQLAILQRAHPFPHARLVDCDLSMDLGELNGHDDRMVIVATEPLTADEAWETLSTGDTRVFVGGQPVWSHHCERTHRFPVPGEVAASLTETA